LSKSKDDKDWDKQVLMMRKKTRDKRMMANRGQPHLRMNHVKTSFGFP
jgi:hypothetical protein